jgi:hypothetical protein
MNGLVYVCGGLENSVALDTCEAYDYATDKWHVVPRMNSARAHFGCVHYWSTGGSVAQQHAYKPAAASTDSHEFILAIGGIGQIGLPLSSVDCFEPSSGRWRSFPKMMAERSAGAFCYNWADNRIYALGGISSGPLKSGEAYDTASRKWVTLPQLTLKRSSTAAAPLNGTLQSRLCANRLDQALSCFVPRLQVECT